MVRPVCGLRGAEKIVKIKVINNLLGNNILKKFRDERYIKKGISMCTFMFPSITLLLDVVLHRSNKNDNSLKKLESVSWLFLLGGSLHKQKKLMFPEVGVIVSCITLNDWW